MPIPDYRFATEGVDGSVQKHLPTAIDPTVTLGPGACVWRYCTILAHTVIGSHVLIADCVSIGRHVVIGDGSRLQHGAALCDGAVIGRAVFIGSNVSLLDTTYPNLEDRSTEVHRPPVIEDGVVVGCNAVILPGVVVHRGAVVGAGSVVTRDIPAGCIAKGNPARVARTTRRQGLVLNEAGPVVG